MPPHARTSWSSHPFRACLLALFLLTSVAAQSTLTQTSANSTVTPAPTSSNASLSLTTSFATITTTLHSGTQNISLTTAIPIVFNVTVSRTQSTNATATNSTTSATSTSTSASASATSDPIHLDTKIDPAFGVLGAILILTGIPSAFLGHKNRWTSFFLIGFYTLSLVCLVLILKFGVLQAINPPSRTLRGLFVLACGVAGIAGGGIAIFFWKVAKYFIGAWGGFAFALWIQCFRNGGLIGPIGFRWIMYIVAALLGFVLCTIPKLHYYVLLISTAFVGASAIMLGVDCYTTAGLKEFYIWNLGFDTLFPKFTNNGIKFPVSQVMEIELGLMGAISIMGIAVQFQILKILQRKLKEIKAEQKRQNDDAEARAAARLASLDVEKEQWDREHPTLPKHGRTDSSFSMTSPLMKDGGDFRSPDADHSAFTLVSTPRMRYQSGVSDFMAAPTPTDELNRAASKQLQSPGALPALDLGGGIGNDAPATPVDPEDASRREALLQEIQTIRRSIELLKAETPDPSSSSNSRHPSLTSRHTLSYDFSSPAPSSSHLRPPRQRDPRDRIQSMELSNLSHSSTDYSAGIGRPTSAPLRDDNWDTYVHDRKLFQPPSGVTAPIPTTPVNPTSRVPVSPAVAEALQMRQKRESVLTNPPGRASPDKWLSTPMDLLSTPKETPSSEDAPLVLRAHHKKSNSQAGQQPQPQPQNVPVTILPPRKAIAQPVPQSPEVMPRVKTFEELVERHREKIHELQAPLTQVEKEHADVLAARSRWEKAKASEKRAVSQRQAEQATALAKEGKRRPSDEAAPETPGNGHSSSRQHSRTLSADVLSQVPGNQGSSKRMSTMKVEDWQKHRLEASPLLEPSASASKRRSGVPFPETQDRSRDKRRMSGLPRSPLN
ncbi:hypothetical protein A0H81_00852 [Grifola frondosa]|uniref:TM7S3/TM198-like domain-containing protein n=1 Tax=Grifola frondosa TaxID=5627 RepID=A0A1C7MUV7_GRIFR|nr:hypothetical protein A0H81_00852 [Grifola frondosa]